MIFWHLNIEVAIKILTLSISFNILTINKVIMLLMKIVNQCLTIIVRLCLTSVVNLCLTNVVKLCLTNIVKLCLTNIVEFVKHNFTHRSFGLWVLLMWVVPIHVSLNYNPLFQGKTLWFQPCCLCTWVYLFLRLRGYMFLFICGCT